MVDRRFKPRSGIAVVDRRFKPRSGIARVQA